MNPNITSIKPRGIGIFIKSAAVSSLIALMALAVFAWTMIRYEQTNIFKQIEERGNLLAASLDRVTANAIVAEDWESVISQCLKMIESGEHVDYIVVTRKSDGFSLVHTTDNWTLEDQVGEKWQPTDYQNQASLRAHPLDANKDEVLHYSYVFSYSGIDWGWIHVGITLEDYHQSIQDVVGIVIKLTLPALVLALLAAFAFARQLTRPISELQQFAEKVAGGDLDHQVAVKSHDEVGALAAAMNQMTHRLKESQRRLQESLQLKAQAREKDVLLKEIHHRVKNNMQILSSLLRMQARQVDGDSVRSFLMESESRIRSMGLIHEKLYQSNNISEIDLSSYLQTLAGELVRMQSANREIDLQIDVRDVELGLDTAMPCGLIVNELVSNALKYAFPEGTEGQIKIESRPAGNGRYHLTVADNGVGLGKEAKPVREGSLGTQLVSMLVDQLDGEISYHNGVGTRVEIEFSESEYTERM